jgi:hypothetical protein
MQPACTRRHGAGRRREARRYGGRRRAQAFAGGALTWQAEASKARSGDRA